MTEIDSSDLKNKFQDDCYDLEESDDDVDDNQYKDDSQKGTATEVRKQLYIQK
jgi:hypothetical protein